MEPESEPTPEIVILRVKPGDPPAAELRRMIEACFRPRAGVTIDPMNDLKESIQSMQAEVEDLKRRVTELELGLSSDEPLAAEPPAPIDAGKLGAPDKSRLQDKLADKR